MSEISKIQETKKFQDADYDAIKFLNEVVEFWNKNYLIFANDCRQKHKELMEKARFMEEHKSIGRNDPCPCGSGKKFKKCCLLEN